VNKKHGKSSTAIYGVWNSMRERCQNPEAAAYANYGGRGITVCERWQSFSNFYEDMGDAPPGLTLDRIDNDRGYSPENCRWATRTEQARNKRSLHRLTVDGEKLSMGEWAERSGVSVGTLWQRVANGWSAEAAVKTPLVRERRGRVRGYRYDDPVANVRFAGCGPLSAQQISTIRDAPKVYGSGKRLAREFGISEAMVSAIRTRKVGVQFHDGDQGGAGANNPRAEVAA